MDPSQHQPPPPFLSHVYLDGAGTRFHLAVSQCTYPRPIHSLVFLTVLLLRKWDEMSVTALPFLWEQCCELDEYWGGDVVGYCGGSVAGNPLMALMGPLGMRA